MQDLDDPTDNLKDPTDNLKNVSFEFKIELVVAKLEFFLFQGG